jgi:hypothetical protein
MMDLRQEKYQEPEIDNRQPNRDSLYSHTIPPLCVRPISIQAARKRLLEKNAIAPSAASPCYASAAILNASSFF